MLLLLSGPVHEGPRSRWFSGALSDAAVPRPIQLVSICVERVGVVCRRKGGWWMSVLASEKGGSEEYAGGRCPVPEAGLRNREKFV